jgi:hypothetical protein
MTMPPEENAPASGIPACYFPVFSGRRPPLPLVAELRGDLAHVGHC